MPSERGGVGHTRPASMRPRGQTPRMLEAVEVDVGEELARFNEAAGADPADARAPRFGPAPGTHRLQ